MRGIERSRVLGFYNAGTDKFDDHIRVCNFHCAKNRIRVNQKYISYDNQCVGSITIYSQS